MPLTYLLSRHVPFPYDGISTSCKQAFVGFIKFKRIDAKAVFPINLLRLDDKGHAGPRFLGVIHSGCRLLPAITVFAHIQLTTLSHNKSHFHEIAIGTIRMKYMSVGKVA